MGTNEEEFVDCGCQTLVQYPGSSVSHSLRLNSDLIEQAVRDMSPQ